MPRRITDLTDVRYVRLESAFGVKRKSDFGSPGPAPAHQRAAGGVLARRPEILFARHTLPPAAGEELRPLFRPHSATDHRTTTPRSPRMAAMRAAPPSSLR
jgi:hypothetical protein